MNFDFNDEQRAIKDSARDLLASRYPLAEVRRLATEDERGFTDGQWDELVSLGWPGIFVDEAFGGQGLGIVELVILQEELGYALAPTPLFSNSAAGLVLQAGAGEQPPVHLQQVLDPYRLAALERLDGKAHCADVVEHLPGGDVFRLLAERSGQLGAKQSPAADLQSLDT